MKEYGVQVSEALAAYVVLVAYLLVWKCLHKTFLD